MNRPPTSNVSVDAITLRYNAPLRRVELALVRRSAAPFAGHLALPGVTLWEGERLADAAERAVRTKVGLGVRGQGQLTVFDEPHRDPRGATLSVVLWAVAEEGEATGPVEWHSFDDVPTLAFDHNQMVEVGRPLLVDRLWRNEAFTRAITGPEFPVSKAVALTESLAGAAPDRGNLNRRLGGIAGLRVSSRKVVAGRGRPGSLWEWHGAPAHNGAAHEAGTVAPRGAAIRGTGQDAPGQEAPARANGLHPHALHPQGGAAEGRANGAAHAEAALHRAGNLETDLD